MRSSVVLLFFIQLVVFTPINGQVGWKNWNAAQFELSFSKKLDIRVSHMRAFDISNGFKADFNQSTIQAGYELNRKWEVATGFVKGGSSTLTDGSSRITARIRYKVRMANVIYWSNSIQGEVHSITENRYRNRVIWTSGLSLRKRLSFLNLLPSVSYSLFYNIGGSPVQYYDSKTGLPVVKQTPDGFHRGRLLLNLNSKITGHLSLSMYFMAQREFNLFTAEYRRINIVKPVTGRVVRAFDDYNVAGMTLKYDFNLYHSNKK